MLLYNSASRLAERAREIFFLILYFSLPPSFFFSFFLSPPSTCSKTHPPNPSRSSFPLSLLSYLSFKTDPSFDFIRDLHEQKSRGG